MEFNELKQQYNEVISKRSDFSKTFDKGGGKYTLAASRTPIHYKDDKGEFHEIDMNIVDGKIEKNIYKVDLLTDSIGYSIVSRKDDSRIDVKLKSIGSKLIDYKEPTIEGNRAIWEDIDKDVDFIIEFRSHRVRCWKNLKSENAAKEITFTVVEDDKDKELNVVEDMIGYDASGKPSIQSKNKTEDVKSVSISTGKNIKEYELKQTFENKVVIRDKTSRVKSESTDVTYPVMIDADVQVSVDTSADDGTDFASNTPTNFTVTANYAWIWSADNAGNDIKRESFTRFDGITIPMGVSIDDATLNLYHQTTGGVSIKVYAFDENDPNAPTATGDLINRTANIASNIVTTPFTNNYVQYPPTTGDMDLKTVDVSSIVQELVNSYDYSSEAMVFFYRFAAQYTGFSKFVSLYAYDWGSTKAAELVINYSLPIQLHYRKSGATEDITLYASDAGWNNSLKVRIGTTTMYAQLDTNTSHANASDLRMRVGGTTYAVLHTEGTPT